MQPGDDDIDWYALSNGLSFVFPDGTRSHGHDPEMDAAIAAEQAKNLTTAQKLMIEDGAPAEFVTMTEAQRAEAWKGRKTRSTSTFAAVKPPAKDEDPVTKALRKELAEAAEKKKAERFARLKELKAKTTHAATAANQETTMKTIAKKTATAKKPAAKKAPAKKAAKKASTAKARTPIAAGAKVIRPGSKLEIVVGLLTRKEGCTAAEVLAACEWPAVSMPQQARAAGLTLRQEKDGKVTRYWGGK